MRGLIGRLFSGGDRAPRFREVRSPGDCRYPLDTIERSLVELARIGDGWWCTIEAGGEEKHTIQIAADQVNTLQEAIDLPGIARRIGLSALADSMVDSAGDMTLHKLPTASPGETTAVVHAVFMTHFGLEDPYPVRCLLES